MRSPGQWVISRPGETWFTLDRHALGEELASKLLPGDVPDCEALGKAAHFPDTTKEMKTRPRCRGSPSRGSRR
jgi:hypothetical protein